MQSAEACKGHMQGAVRDSVFDWRRLEPKIGEVVDAAGFDPARWQQVADELRGLAPNCRSNLQAHDPAFDGPMLLVQSGWSQSFLDAYRRHLASVNDVAKQWPRAPHLTPLMLPDAFVPNDRFLKSEFYNDGMKPEGDAECATGIKFYSEQGRHAAICVQYGARRKDDLHAVLSPLLKALGPRLKRALQFNRIALRRQNHPLRADLMHSLLDPALIVDKERRVLSANRRAEAMIDARDSLCVGARNVLSFGTQQADVTFGRLVREACDRAAGSGGQFEFICEASGSRRVVSILPVAQNLQSLVGCRTLPLFVPSVLALVVLRCLETGPSSADLQLRFGLTKAEAKIADALRQGGSVPEIADRLGIAYDTARNQLKAVFAKTDTHRQSELVALLLRLRG